MQVSIRGYEMVMRFMAIMGLTVAMLVLVAGCDNESRQAPPDGDVVDQDTADGDDVEIGDQELDGEETDKEVDGDDVDGDVTEEDIDGDVEPVDTDIEETEGTDDIDDVDDIDDTEGTDETDDTDDAEPDGDLEPDGDIDTDDPVDGDVDGDVVDDVDDVDDVDPDEDVVDLVDEDDSITIQCYEDVDCLAGQQCIENVCVDTGGDLDDTEGYDDVVCTTDADCLEFGMYCNSFSRCQTDCPCAEGYTCTENGYCEAEGGDTESFEIVEVVEEEEVICCTAHTDCDDSQWCDDSQACGLCRFGCWQDAQCENELYEATCNPDTHRCEFIIPPDGDVDEVELDLPTVSGTILLSEALFHDVDDISVLLYNEDPGLSRRKLDPVQTVTAGNPDTVAFTYSYEIADIDPGVWYLVVDAVFGTAERERFESRRHPFTLGYNQTVVDADFYIGVQDPLMGFIGGSVVVDALDSERPVHVRLYDFDPEGVLLPNYVMDVAAGAYNSESGSRPYECINLESDRYWVQAYFADTETPVRDAADNPLDINLDDPQSMSYENIDLYLNAVNPEMGSIDGTLLLDASLTGQPQEVRLYRAADFGEDQFVMAAVLGVIEGNQRSFSFSNLDSGEYWVRAQVTTDLGMLYGPADVAPITIDITDPGQRVISGVNCYVGVSQPDRGSVAGTISYHFAYTDMQPGVELYDTAPGIDDPQQIVPVFDASAETLSGTFFAGNLEEGDWYLVGAMNTGNEWYRSEYLANPVTISVAGTKDHTGLDLYVEPPLEWGSMRGQITLNPTFESLPVYVQIYVDPYTEGDAAVMAVQAEAGVPDDGIMTWRMDHIPPGAYVVRGRVDIGSDNDEANDAWGEYEQSLNFMYYNRDRLHYENIDFEIYQDQGAISGKVYVPEALLAHPVYVSVYDAEPFECCYLTFSEPVAVVTATPMAGQGYALYDVGSLPEGTYWLEAWADEDEDGERTNNFTGWYGDTQASLEITRLVTSYSDIDLYLGVPEPGTSYISGTVYLGPGYENQPMVMEWIDPSQAYPDVSVPLHRFNMGNYDSVGNTYQYVLDGLADGSYDVWLADGAARGLYMLPRIPYAGNSLVIDGLTSQHENVDLYYGLPHPVEGSVSGTVTLTEAGMEGLVYLRISDSPLSSAPDPSLLFEYAAGNRTIWLWERDAVAFTTSFDAIGPLPTGDYYIYAVHFPCGEIDLNFNWAEYSGNPVHIDVAQSGQKDISNVDLSYEGVETLACPQE